MSTDTTEKILNPMDSAPTAHGAHPYAAPAEGLDATWAQEVDSAAAQEVKKRNGAPPGTYVTDPGEYEPIINVGKRDEKNKAGDVMGQRDVATIIARGTAKIKGALVTQILRFEMSPDQRHKKIYEGQQWTGAYDEAKDDLAHRLWCDAVTAFEEQNGKGSFTRGDILAYLKSTPVALRTMQTDRGDLLVLSLQNRGRRKR